MRKCLAGRTYVLVLDEPTGNLNRVTGEVVQRVNKDEIRDNTVITVVHRLESMTDVDLILMLEKGKIVKIGRPDEVLWFDIASVSPIVQSDHANLYF
jgi:ABC-type multidrug transport system fused ATPase/permease subunit